MESSETKTLAAWRLELKRFGRQHWLKFYQELMGQAVSHPRKFYKALELYGFNVLFESIVASSMNELKGDPYFYVMKVAENKWKEIEEAKDSEDFYEEQIKRAIEVSRKHNEELAKKLGLR